MDNALVQLVPVAGLLQKNLLQIEDGNHGEYRPRREEFGPQGVAFIRAADMTRSGIDFDHAEKINSVARSRIRKGIGAPLDVLLSHKGTVGKVALAPTDAPPYVCSPQTTFWRSLDDERIYPRFLFYALQSPAFQNQLGAIQGQTDMAPYVSLTDQRKLRVPVTSIEVQRKIADALGALDDKITVNHRIAESARSLASLRFQAPVEAGTVVRRELASISVFISRGVTPRYTLDPDQLTVLNQKCIRNGRVSFEPSRRTQMELVPNQKLLRLNDILVNSTGMGTLGRVARWMDGSPATVDSHVTIVRIDPSKADPVCAGFAMLGIQQLIESLGEGSTGQTELSRVRLGALILTMPNEENSRQLRPVLDSLEAQGKAALDESSTLTKLRDTLLPKLMSGEIRVRDAERIVEDAT